MTNQKPDQIKKKIIELAKEYSKLVHRRNYPTTDRNYQEWMEGDTIPYSGRVFNQDEVAASVSTALDFWLTLGNEGNNFQKELAEFLGIKSTLIVNSGSSANLIALATLTSHKIDLEKRLTIGDEVITVAAGFPTTVAPIIQIGCKPVFIDADPITGNAKCDQLESVYRKGRTKAVIFAHALGNPFDIEKTLNFCKKYNLWLIEDNCDSLGSTYSMTREQAERLGIYNNSPGLDDGEERIIRWTGTWGDLSTQSFYPPHHITTGEGGSVNIVKDKRLKAIAESFRDWGRDCWCPSGIDNSCGKRFDWKLGELPEGYDHKYTYSHFGYNLKPLDIQAAIGNKQIKRLPEFIKARERNWEYLREKLSCLDSTIEFSLPTHAVKRKGNGQYEWDESGNRSSCSWFGFKIAFKQGTRKNTRDLAKHLDKNKIGNRMLFGGNLLKQPAFIEYRKFYGEESIRIVEGELSGADEIMMNSLFVGTYPGLSEKMLEKIVATIIEYADTKEDEKHEGL